MRSIAGSHSLRIGGTTGSRRQPEHRAPGAVVSFPLPTPVPQNSHTHTHTHLWPELSRSTTPSHGKAEKSSFILGNHALSQKWGFITKEGRRNGCWRRSSRLQGELPMKGRVPMFRTAEKHPSQDRSGNTLNPY